MERTRRVAQFIADTRFAGMPAAAVARAKEAIMDSLGVAVAGAQDEAGTIAAELAREERAVEEAAVFGQRFRTSAGTAAFTNGLAGHALDFDSSFAIGGQPMAGLTAAVFALGEPRQATGAQVIEAYIVGFQVTGKIIRCVPSHTEHGWHSTGTLGAIGSAAASSRLLGLNADQVCMALGLACSMSSGLAWNFGSMGKPLHAGLAARSGVLAARLAERGYTANPLMLEGPSGFFETYAGDEYDLAPLDEIGQGLEMADGVRYKAYPCGGLTHTAIDAVLDVRRAEGITPDAIDRIEAGVTAGVAARIIYRIPETALQGKFSIPYILARAALDGKVTIDSFTEEAVRDPAATALAQRITMTVDPDLKDQNTISRPSRVRIHLKDGRSFFREVRIAKGSPGADMTADELRVKFVSNASHAMSDAAVAKSIDMLANLETLADVSHLSQLLMA